MTKEETEIMFIMKPGRRIYILSAVLLLVAAALLAACGSSNSTTDSSEESTQGQGFTWSATSDCTSCHATEAKSALDTTMLAATHANAGVKCVSCHTDVDALKNAHDGVKLETKASAGLALNKTTVDEQTCLSSACHNTTLAELATKTAASTVLTDKDGTTVNPHLAPTLTKAHVDAKMTCTSCHSMHKTPDPIGFCVSCHHHTVFQCGTCHP